MKDADLDDICEFQIMPPRRSRRIAQEFSHVAEEENNR